MCVLIMNLHKVKVFLEHNRLLLGCNGISIKNFLVKVITSYQLGIVLISKILLSLVVLIQARCPLQVNKVTLLAYQDQLVDKEIETQVILPSMADLVVSMALHVVVMVVSLMIFMEVVQIIPLLLS